MLGRPTLDDVALIAGVSAKTVSRVVNGEPHVSNAVREAVEAAIHATGYEPNIAARTLASSRSFLIGAFGSNIDSSYFHKLNAHLVRSCQRRGRNVVVEQFDTSSHKAALGIKNIIRKINFEGIILTQGLSDSPEVIACLDAEGINSVGISPRKIIGRSKAVLVDEASGEASLAEHFWRNGHRDFAIIQAPPHVKMNRGSTLIQRIIELGADRKNISEITLNLNLPGLEAGRLAALEILNSDKRPTAVFAFSDEIAAGAIGFLLAHGIQIPGEISVAGFDDSEIAQAVWPALTTVRQPIDTIADMAASLLLDGKASDHTDQRLCPVELVVRQSTGLARDR